MKNAFCVLIAGLLLTSVAMPQGVDLTGQDLAEVKNFPLDNDKLTKYVAATKGLMSFKKDRDEIQAATQNDPDTRTISGMVRIFDKHPAVAAALKKAGMTPREYSVMTMTMVTTVMVVAMKKQGAMKTIPNTVSAENVAFVDQNFDAIQELMISLHTDQ